MAGLRRWLRRPVRRVRDDLAADPYLPYLLGFAAAACGFGVWFRVPNFAAPDEYSRLIQPMKVAGAFVADPGVDSVRRALADGRALGATFYLYALTLVPVLLVVVLTGQLGEFAGLGTIDSRWTLWHAAPAWFWTAAILSGRLVSVLLGVVCVYLTYRIGVELRDRFAGRVAALSLALSVGFLSQAHLVGEDLPMLSLLLVTVLLANRYVETGRARHFLLGSLTAGLAIAFKLSGGIGVFVLGAAYLHRAATAEDVLDALVRPNVIVGSLLIGIATVYVGIPSVLVGGPSVLLERVLFGVGTKTTTSGGFEASVWYWIVWQSVGGLGWPLFIATIAGLLGSLRTTVRTRTVEGRWAVLISGIAIPFLVFASWEFVRLRHVVPLFPLAFVLAAAEASRFRTRRPRTANVILALVFVSSAIFAGVGLAQYTTDPRDRATAWIQSNVDGGERVEVYENSIADIGTPHGKRTIHYHFPEENATHVGSLVLNESAFTRWMLDMPHREPSYIQLTDGELQYLDSRNPKGRQYPERREYIRDLLAGEYNYTVVAEFGRRPPRESKLSVLLAAGIRPSVEGRDEAVVILARQ